MTSRYGKLTAAKTIWPPMWALSTGGQLASRNTAKTVLSATAEDATPTAADQIMSASQFSLMKAAVG